MLFWKPKPKKKAEKLTVKRHIAPSAIEPPKDIPHITIPKPEKSAAKGSTVTQTEKPRHYQKEFLTTFKQITSAGYRSFEVWPPVRCQILSIRPTSRSGRKDI